MKILLFGEYSGLFNCLQEGLKALGHDVFLASEGNGFKNYPSDFRWDKKWFNKCGKFRTSLYALNIWLHKSLLTGYDIVYFVDANFISAKTWINKPIYKYLIKHNKKSFVCGAGDTAIMVDYWIKSKEKYFDYVNGIVKFQKQNGIPLLYPNKELREWEDELLKIIDGYIPIWYEYAQPFRNYSSLRETVRIPIPCENFEYKPNIVKDKIVFFHGVPSREDAKGTPYIREAFKRMKTKHGDVAEFHCAGGLPFNEYMDLISRTNVVVDDAQSYSIAMNGLFSMAKGKIIMGGAEPEGNKELGIEGVNPVFNITNDVDQICSQIEYIIEHKDKIEEWGLASRKFVEKYHDHIEIAKQYERIFKKALENGK